MYLVNDQTRLSGNPILSITRPLWSQLLPSAFSSDSGIHASWLFDTRLSFILFSFFLLLPGHNESEKELNIYIYTSDYCDYFEQDFVITFEDGNTNEYGLLSCQKMWHAVFLCKSDLTCKENVRGRDVFENIMCSTNNAQGDFLKNFL